MSHMLVGTTTASVPLQERTRIWMRRHTGLLLVLPSVILLLAVGIFPMIYSIAISLLRYEPKLPGRPFIGLANYKSILTSAEFWNSIKVMLIFTVSAVTIEFLLGMGLALLMAGKVRGKRFFLAVLMLPVMMVPVVVGYTWRILWHPTYGPIDHLLSLVVGHRVTIDWLNKTPTAFAAIITTDVWQWTPFMFLVLLAGLTSVNPELQQAAAIDGANRWQTFWRVTVPVLWPVVLVALLIRTLDVLKIFDVIYVTTNGGPGYSTQSFALYMYNTGAKFAHMGLAAAAAWVFIILFSTLISFAVRRVRED